MKKREYLAYLLRLWREKQDGSWRASLENPNRREHAGFASLAELVAFLESKTGEKVAPLAAENPEETKSAAARK